MSRVVTGDPARPLVVAVGNRFCSDDGVAGVVLDGLATMATVTERADLVELDGEATRLIDAWEHRGRVVVVDAVHAPEMAPGELVTVGGPEPADVAAGLRRVPAVSGHSAGLTEALRLASVMGRLPAELFVVGVAVGSVDHGIELTPPVAAAVPAARAAVLRVLGLGRVTGETRAIGEGSVDHVPV